MILSHFGELKDFKSNYDTFSKWKMDDYDALEATLVYQIVSQLELLRPHYVHLDEKFDNLKTSLCPANAEEIRGGIEKNTLVARVEASTIPSLVVFYFH